MVSKLNSFDRTEQCSTQVDSPEKYSEIFKKIDFPIIARGMGLSYCNASTINNGSSIDMRNFNRFLEFNPQKKYIRIESGVCVGDLNNFLVKNGYLLPVLPGYPMITIGGCVAFNIHGKSQYKFGNFINWIEEIDLYNPSFGEMTCSRLENKELFFLTIGGMGLTGIILSVKIKIMKLPGNRLEVQTFKAKNLQESVRVMMDNADKFDYIYSWNNLNLRGKSFGKGIIYFEKIQKKISKNDKEDFKNKLLFNHWPTIFNNLTINLISYAYYLSECIKPSMRILNLFDDAFPLYGKEIYYRFFGNRGFREYQVLFPFNTWDSASLQIQKLINKTGIGITLGSLKIFKGQQNYLSFSGSGVCLTIDVVNTKQNLEFFKKMDKITIQNKGIVNLSKDSRISNKLVMSIFSEFSNFKNSLNKYNSEKLLNSDLAKRLMI